MSQHPTIETAKTVEEIRDGAMRMLLSRATVLFRGKDRIDHTAVGPFNRFKTQVRRAMQAEIATILDLSQISTILHRVVDTEKPGNDHFNSRVKGIIDEVSSSVGIALQRLDAASKDKENTPGETEDQFSGLGLREKILLLPEKISRILVDYAAALELNDDESAQELFVQVVDELLRNSQRFSEEIGAADELLEENEKAILRLETELKNANRDLELANTRLQELEERSGNDAKNLQELERQKRMLTQELDDIRGRLDRTLETARRLQQENDQLKQQDTTLSHGVQNIKKGSIQPSAVSDVNKDLETLVEVGALITTVVEKLGSLQGFSAKLQQVGEIKTLVQEELERKDKEIAELRAQVAHRTLVQVGEQNVAVVHKDTRASQGPQFKLQLRSSLADLEEKIAVVNTQAMEIFAWLQNVKEMKTREFTKLKVVFEGGALAALEAKERRVDQQIAVVERKHEELQVTLTCMESTKRDIEEYLAALERVEKGIATSDISLPAMEPQDLHMPTLEELMGNSLLPVPAVKPSDGVIEEASSTDDKKCEIKGLPFIVEFTAIERDQVRQREALIGSFKGMGVAKIRETFPTSTLDDSEKYYYGLLVERLHEGTFLENFKKAVVILGALRSGNEFCPRISRTVITGMKANTVKIALALGPETEAVSWALIQADILSAMNETLVFVRRIGVRGKFGRLNELTPLGQTASQVWTKDLLETDTLKLRQLAALHAYAQSRKD